MIRGTDGAWSPLHIILIAIALLAIAVPLGIVLTTPRTAPTPLKITVPNRIAPPTIIPEVEPVKLQAVDPDDARAFNATVPIVTGANPAARPFRAAFDTEARTRATDCLAAAVYYEAGDDAVGERAVAQVILNRVRHPAFPRTVCGVVFQGSERSTGCQFTFTCDGAMIRYTPSEAAWSRAREVAAAALSGQVYAPVGTATHYHTDWVVPYWSASLDKIAKVGTHLFFRWTGWWGTPRAFARSPLPFEPAVPQLARLSETHRNAAGVIETDGTIAVTTPFFGRGLQPLAGEQDSFLTTLDPAQEASFPALAQQACGDRPKCKFMGWTDPSAMGFSLPLAPAQMAAMSFSYLRDRPANLERTLYNCTEFRRHTGRACMKRMALRIEAPVVEESTAPVAPPAGPADLTGVRRKPTTNATPTPLPTPARNQDTSPD